MDDYSLQQRVAAAGGRGLREISSEMMIWRQMSMNSCATREWWHYAWTDDRECHHMLMTYMYGRLVLSVRSAENLQRFLCSDVEAGRLDNSFFIEETVLHVHDFCNMFFQYSTMNKLYVHEGTFCSRCTQHNHVSFQIVKGFVWNACMKCIPVDEY